VQHVVGAAADVAHRAAMQRTAMMRPAARRGIRPILTGGGGRASFTAFGRLFR
jgi:hypothetical protein